MLIGRLDDDSYLGTDIILWYSKHASEFYREKKIEFRLSRWIYLFILS